MPSEAAQRSDRIRSISDDISEVNKPNSPNSPNLPAGERLQCSAPLRVHG